MSVSAESKTGGKSKILGAIFLGLAAGGLIGIGWAYLKDGSLIEALGITLVSLALAAFIVWIRRG